MPYQNCVPNDPSMEDMKKIVVTEGLRPDLEERWKRSEVRNAPHTPCLIAVTSKIKGDVTILGKWGEGRGEGRNSM